MPLTSTSPRGRNGARALAGNGAAVTGRHRRNFARSGLDFWFDAALLAAYTLAYSIGFTRLAIHEWIGIALGLALLVHFAGHWGRRGGPPPARAAGAGPGRAVRFLRQLAAVTVTVTVAETILITAVVTVSAGRRRPASRRRVLG